jgi:virulence-associated protein VagC
MSFKFKLGELVVPSMPKEMGLPVGPSKVTAIQLGGYIQIEPLGTDTHRRELVEAKYYERFEEEDQQSNN